MISNLNIKVNGLSDSISLKVVNSLTEIINKFSSLDLRRFSKIIITSHFERDIEVLTSIQKSVFKNRYRANKSTYALVLTIPKDNDFELVLIMRANFIKNILQNHYKQSYKSALHILHHELAHIHDNNKKIDSFKDIMQTSKYKGIDSIIFPVAETCWSEYIANYISSNSALDTKYPSLIAKSLAKQIKQVNQDIKTQILAYKINNSRKDLLDSSIEQIKSLLKNASYLLGYLHGLNITLQELDDEVNYILESSYFVDIWEALQFEFYSLSNVYPDGFININIYRNLAFYIEAFFNQMGIIFYINDKNKLELKVV